MGQEGCSVGGRSLWRRAGAQLCKIEYTLYLWGMPKVLMSCSGCWSWESRRQGHLIRGFIPTRLGDTKHWACIAYVCTEAVYRWSPGASQHYEAKLRGHSKGDWTVVIWRQRTKERSA